MILRPREAKMSENKVPKRSSYPVVQGRGVSKRASGANADMGAGPHAPCGDSLDDHYIWPGGVQLWRALYLIPLLN